MIHFIKIKNSLSLLLFAGAVFFLVLTIMLRFKTDYQIPSEGMSCTANVHYILGEGNEYRGDVRFSYDAHGRGLFAYSGQVFKNSIKDSTLLRILYFDIAFENNDYFQISNFDIKKNINDTMDDASFHKQIFDLSSGPRRLKIRKLTNTSYIMGNVFSPVMICITDG